MESPSSPASRTPLLASESSTPYVAVPDIEAAVPAAAGEAEDQLTLRTLLPWRLLFTKRAIPWWILAAIAATVTALLTIYHVSIVLWLEPIAERIRAVPGGWIIPIVILVVISFPPLFGHEIVAVLCGVVYGLGAGFAIVAAGTFLGEIVTFYAFRYLFTEHAAKLQSQSLNYHVMVHIVREGGFWIVFLARLSAIPAHFTTALFATCGMSFRLFAITAFLSLPKQLATVYLGVLFLQVDAPVDDKIASNTVLAVTVVVTIVAGWLIWRKMVEARPRVAHEWRAWRELVANGSPEMIEPDSPADRLYGATVDETEQGFKTPSPFTGSVSEATPNSASSTHTDDERIGGEGGRWTQGGS